MRAPSVSAARIGRIRQARTQSHSVHWLAKTRLLESNVVTATVNQQGESLARTACTFSAPRLDLVAPSPLPGRARTLGMFIGLAAVRQR